MGEIPLMKKEDFFSGITFYKEQNDKLINEI